ncbi:MAG TPA: hypothetical protein PKW42_12520, partial [bacterium]|nr:hypothetical protein [bacterium]
PNEYQPIIRYLRRCGVNTFHQFSYRQNLGTVPLSAIAASLQHYAGLLPKERNLVTIGLSQGGIIAAYWLEFLGGKKYCRTCITVCSPFHGSWLSYLLPLPGLVDLRPGSSLLSSLRQAMATSSVRYVGLWNPFDLFVFPGWSGKCAGQQFSRAVPALSHPLTFWMPLTIRIVCKELTSH